MLLPKFLKMLLDAANVSNERLVTKYDQSFDDVLNKLTKLDFRNTKMTAVFVQKTAEGRCALLYEEGTGVLVSLVEDLTTKGCSKTLVGELWLPYFDKPASVDMFKAALEVRGAEMNKPIIHERPNNKFSDLDSMFKSQLPET